ncbi:hypothetical protein FISHEDRAFT_72414 [Fistulina hepatica ATCC 64428]|uniref:Uncharacterized protein n=1 Tax=Fistulina hepatica ATCC 64428 TaxID=1128425 RepID=A0A0D7AF73_9AGAR|nr:hypothetical protein FISHEDRAFT_72414 [Fistulina hepatica ATCC 64428]
MLALNLIRRISGSVVPRLDRPWPDDATSNAPCIGRKRRLSSVEVDDARVNVDARPEKRAKDAVLMADASADTSRATSETPPSSPDSPEIAKGVKEVTKGVSEVKTADEALLAPANIPLPEEKAGELDEAGPLPSPELKAMATSAGAPEAVADVEHDEDREALDSHDKKSKTGAAVTESKISDDQQEQTIDKTVEELAQLEESLSQDAVIVISAEPVVVPPGIAEADD